MIKIKEVAIALGVTGILTSSGLIQAQAVVAPPPGSTGPNKVYIEQVGSSNRVTIEQVGGTNNVGGVLTDALSVDNTGLTTLTPTAPSSSNYATIAGSSNQVTLTQTGSSNSAQYHIRGNNNVYSSTVLGNSNKTKLNIGNATSLANLRNAVTETITGDGNIVIQDVVGNDITSTTAITGSSNEVTQELKSNKGTSLLTVTGSNNVVNAQQVDSAGANGHYLKDVIQGSYNSITTQQQGSNDTTIDIKTAGDHNTITVRTSSSAIATPVSAIAR